MYGSLTTLIPTRHRVTLKLSAYFGWGNAAFTTTTPNYFVVGGNSLNTPFTTGLNWNASTNAVPTAVGNSAISDPFPGFSYLSGLYKYNKVYSSSLSFSAMPEVGGDALIVTIYAYNSTAGLSLPLGLPESTMQLAHASKVCAVGTANKFNVVRSRASTCDVIGLTKAEFDGLAPTVDTTDVSGFQAWNWAVQCCTADGQSSGSTGIPAQVTIAMDVEFTNPNIPQL
jgi:hypothetical protein